jgi:hypothetical protein
MHSSKEFRSQEFFFIISITTQHIMTTLSGDNAVPIPKCRTALLLLLIAGNEKYKGAMRFSGMLFVRNLMKILYF